ncbi:hypothetical protein HOLleu_20940 [Holothuria leucospilota]|uniref:Centrosomal protein of 164 kDa n=1 Tax=Holothuria leucospilota TaxID=206669 RepID=A0A9Q1H6G8_HOLLE|nr:hypothetical protein HOLleu_20940 [Holothuria leucospilota]
MMVGNQLVLEEDYDENYQPTEEDILEYAQVVGINPDTEPELMWIAREGINAPLPNDWKPCQDTGGGDIYYFNFATGESMWDHPCDEFYRSMVAEEREKMKLAGGGGQKKETKKKKEKKDKKEKTEKKSEKKPEGMLAPLKSETLNSSVGSLGGTKDSYQSGSLRSTQGSPAKVNGRSDQLSFLKSGKEDNLSLKGLREENLQMLQDMSEEDETPRLNLDLDLQDIGNLGYDESEVSDAGKPPKVSASEEDDEDDVSLDFGIDAGLSKRLGLMDASNLQPVDDSPRSPELPQSRFLKSLKKDKPADLLSPTKSPLASKPKEIPEVDNSSHSKTSYALPTAQELSGKSVSRMNEEKQEIEEQNLRQKMQEDLDVLKEKLEKEQKEEEERLRMAHEHSLTEMKKRLEEEIEGAKYELLEDKEDSIKKLKEKIEKEQEEEEDKILKEKEKRISEMRKQVKEETEDEEAMLMEGKTDAIRKMKEKIKQEQQEEENRLREEHKKTLDNLKEELQELENTEEEKIDAAKEAVKDRINTEVDIFEKEMQEKMEKENEKTVSDLKAKYEAELGESLKEIEEKYKMERQEKESDLKKKHQRDMDDLLARITENQEEERKRAEEKERASREKQMALDEMEDGMEKVFMERKQELKEEQSKELEKLKKDHERALQSLKKELEKKESRLKDDNKKRLDELTERMNQEHEQEMKEIKEKFEKQKESYHQSHEEQEKTLKEVSEALKQRQEELTRQRKEIEKEEKKFEKKRRQLDRADIQLSKMDVTSSRSEKQSEMKEMHEDREELMKAIQEERQMLTSLEEQKKVLEKKVKKLREESTKFPPVPTTEHNGVHQENQTESKPRHKQRTRSSSSDLMNIDELEQPSPAIQQTRKMVNPRELLSPERTAGSHGDRLAHLHSRLNSLDVDLQMEDLSVPSTGMVHSGLRHAWLESPGETDLSELSDLDLKKHSNLRVRLEEENSAIRNAREFLRKQRQSLKARQTALDDAWHSWKKRQELQTDTYNDGPMLEDVRLGLEREALELDKALLHVTSSRRMLREKEQQVKKLKQSLQLEDGAVGQVSSLSGQKPSVRTQRSSLSFSESDHSSSLSDHSGSMPNHDMSSRINQDEVDEGHHHKGSPAIHQSASHHSKNRDLEHITTSLNKMNEQLQNVMTMLNHQNPPHRLEHSTDGRYVVSDHPNTPHRLEPPRDSSYILPSNGYVPRHSSVYSSSQRQPINSYVPPGPNAYSAPMVSNGHLAGRYPSYDQPMGSFPSRSHDPGIHSSFWHTTTETADETLERKWKAYFGDHRPFIKGALVAAGFPSSRETEPSGRFTGYIPAREQMSSNKGNSQGAPTEIPTELKLQQLNDWLKEVRGDHGNQSTQNSTLLSTAITKSSSTPNLSRGQPRVKLELDDNNDILVREVP